MKKFVSIALCFSWIMAQEDVITLPSGARLDLPHTANIRVDTIRVKSGSTFAAESPRDFSTAVATGNGTIITGQPLVTSVSSTTSDGTYNAGDTLLITVTFSENVIVAGTPQLTLETGTNDAVINYLSGSDTPTLLFRYIVANGHTSSDLSYNSTTALSLSNAFILDFINNSAVLTLPVPGASNSLKANKALVIDTEAPTAGTVNDGSGTDVAYSNSSTSLTANWTGFSDALSGISGYEIAIGTTSGGTEVLAWTNVGNVTTYTKTDLTLNQYTPYYISTRAQDAAGNYSSIATANGVILDWEPAIASIDFDSTTYNATEWDAVTAINGTAADISGGSGLATVEINIQRSTDNYYWTGTDWSATLQWLGVSGTDTWNYSTITAADLTDGATYTVNTRAFDVLGNVGPLDLSGESDSFIYDVSEPNSVLSIADDYYNASGWSSNQPIQGTATDEFSGVSKVEVLIKRATGAKFWSGSRWTADSTWIPATGTATWQYSITSDSLTDTETYTIRSRATDGSSNLETSYSSDSFTFDSTLPVSVVNIEREYYNDGNWNDVSSISGTSSDSTSGISTMEISLRRSNDLAYWSGLVWTLSETWLSPNQLTNWTYYFTDLDNTVSYTVQSRATDNAGNVQTTYGSDSFIYDITLPLTGSVSDGLNSADQQWTNDLTTLSAIWTGFSDALSGLASYEYSIGTVAGGTQTTPWIDVGLDTSMINSTLTLESGLQYFVNIRAIDQAGNISTVVSSNGTYTDNIPPEITSAYDGSLTEDKDFQQDSSSMIIAWAASDSRELSDYSISIGTDTGLVDIVSWTDVGSVSDYTFTGLSLQESTRYYANVKTIDLAGNESDIFTTDGIIIDRTGPVVGTVNDGPGDDIDWVNNNFLVTGNINDFSDALSGIAEYQYSLGVTPGGTQSQPWTSNALDTAIIMLEFLVADVTYYLNVRAIDSVGNVGPYAASDGFGVDQTNPVAGNVYDGTGGEAEIEWTNNTISVSAYWSGFTDTYSGIEFYEYAIGTPTSDVGVVDWTSVDTNHTFFHDNLSLINGVIYHASVRATDGVGNASLIARSNGFTIDTDNAVITTIIEGHQTEDWDYQGSDSSFMITWAGNDDASGINFYEYAVGTEPDSTDIVNWTLAGLNTSVTIDSLELEEGRDVYYGSIRATDQAGNTSAAFSGDGIEVDISSPSTGTVIDGTNDDLVFTGADTNLTASWNGFSDNISGIAYYEYGIGLSPVSVDVLSWVNNGLDTTISIGELNLDHATVYYQNVRAIDLVDNVSEGVASNGITTDHSPPEAGSINDGIAADETWLITNDRLYLNWNGFQDSTSGIQYYEYAIGTVPGQSNIVPWVNVGMDTASVDSELVLNHGTTYYGSVRVTDNVGNMSVPFSSNGITVDLFDPTVGIPFDGVGGEGDLNYQANTNSLFAHWAPTQESELDYYEYSFSTTIGGDDIVPWTATTDTIATVDSLNLIHAQIYFANLRAFDLAGNPSFVSSSNGVTVDLHGPITGTVIDGLLEDEMYTGSLDSLVASWTDFADTVSGIQYFEYGVGTTSGNLDIREWTEIGPVLNINAGDLTLIDETTYYISVKATDIVGNISEIVTTNGITADHSGPGGTIVTDGDSTDIDLQNNLVSFSGHWESFGDEYSGLSYHESALYNVTNTSYEESWTNVGIDTTITFYGLDLVAGATYELHVRGVDSVGNTGSIVNSDGVLIDLTAPIAPLDLVGWFTTGRILLEWTANTEVDLGYYSIYGGTENNPTDLLFTSTENTVEAFMPSYEDGTLYYLRITATDIPGNESDFTNEVIGIPQETIITSISPDTSLLYASNQNQLTLKLSQPLNNIGMVSSSSIGYPEGMQITSSYSSTDTSILLQFNEPFASLDTINLVLSGILDWSNNGTSDKNLTLHTYLLADYNSDNQINIIDLTSFATAWSDNLLSFELGPVSGTVPHLIPVLNGKFDLRDAMTFTRMWHWFNQTPTELPSNGSADIGLLLSINQQDRRLEISIPEEAKAGQIIVYYPPLSKQFSTIKDITNEKQIYLSSQDQQRGQMLVEWADLGSQSLKKLIINSQSLDRSNADVTITHTIFNDQKEIISSGNQIVALKAVPDSYALHNNFPNPFNPITNIFYDLPKSGHVSIVIYDLLGRKVITLVNETMESGYYSTRWNGYNHRGQSVSAGIYFYHLQTGEYSQAQKMLLVK